METGHDAKECSGSWRAGPNPDQHIFARYGTTHSIFAMRKAMPNSNTNSARHGFSDNMISVYRGGAAETMQN